jgi:hypothetical protein
MILQKLNPVKYQSHLVQCGQFFADTQSDQGNWSYGFTVSPIATGDLPKPTIGTSKKGENTEMRAKIKIRKRPQPAANRTGIFGGDNSNSQYAALGIRACHAAGVELPTETLKLAKSYWERAQLEDGGWHYNYIDRTTAVQRGLPAPILKGYGSMTCGGIASLAIFKTLLGENIAQDGYLKKGFAWLASHFAVDENPGQNFPIINGVKVTSWHYYYLYSLERAGDMTSTAKLGTHDWYAEGAQYLLKNQIDDGSWKARNEFNIPASCFAILFLKRATAPLIKTGDEKPKAAVIIDGPVPAPKPGE